MMISSEAQFSLNPPISGVGNYTVQLNVAHYGYVVIGLALILLILRLTTHRISNAAVLSCYVLVEVVVITLGMLPSGKLLEGTTTYIDESPISLAPRRLAQDFFVMLATVGILAFDFRDWLVQLSRQQPAMITFLWITSATVILGLFVIQRRNKFALAGLVWFVIALAPLRIKGVGFFALNNLYLTMPVLSIAGAAMIKNGLARRPYITLAASGILVVLWAGTLITVQRHLHSMGVFAQELHSVLISDSTSKSAPGPLRVIVNVPDPFRLAYQDPKLARWMAFRVAQSAMTLGGYSDENVSFVERKVLQILAVEHGSPCDYRHSVIDTETMVISTVSSETLTRCLSQLTFIDFDAQQTDGHDSATARRKKQYSFRPLTDAEVYTFDGKRLRRIEQSHSHLY
jgi:hypothetical protein